MTNPIKAIIVFGIVALTLLMCLKYGCSPKQSANDVDSLSYYKQAIKIEKFQHGKEQAILLNEAEKERRLKIDALAKVDSLKQRENNAMAHYKTTTANIVQASPNECKEYVEQVVDACEIMLAAKDETNKALEEAQYKTQNELNDYYCLVESYQAENKTDSTLLATSEAETKQAKKETKKAKFINKLILTAALVYTGVVVYLTSVE